MDDDMLAILVREALADEPPAALVDAVASWPLPAPTEEE